jgi:hypothetical protein
MKVAVLSPVSPRPPSGCGGIEWIVALLATRAGDAGHEVTLASGDSPHPGAASRPCSRRAERPDQPTFWEPSTR